MLLVWAVVGCPTSPQPPSPSRSPEARTSMASYEVYRAARDECRRLGARADGGFCPVPCSYEHGASRCSTSEVCIPGLRPRDFGFVGGCYARCGEGKCDAGTCRSVVAPLPTHSGAADTHVEVCVPEGARAEFWE